jgi:hypothetical protein
VVYWYNQLKRGTKWVKIKEIHSSCQVINSKLLIGNLLAIITQSLIKTLTLQRRLVTMTRSCHAPKTKFIAFASIMLQYEMTSLALSRDFRKLSKPLESLRKNEECKMWLSRKTMSISLRLTNKSNITSSIIRS